MSAGYILYSLDPDKFRQLVEQPTQAQLTALARLLKDGLEEYEDEFDDDDPISKWPAKVKPLAEIAAKRLALPDWYGDLSPMGKTLWEGAIFSACQDSDDIDVGFRVDNDGVYWDVIEVAWKHLSVVPNTISDVALSTFGTRPYRYQQSPQAVQSREEYERGEEGRRASAEALNSVLGQFLEAAQQGTLDPEKLLSDIEQHQGVSQQHKQALKGLLSDDDSAEDDDEDDLDDGDDWFPMHSMHAPDEVQKMLSELKSIEAIMIKSKKKDVLQQYQEDLLPAIERVANDGRMLFVQVNT
jgi:hypothetical protein